MFFKKHSFLRTLPKFFKKWKFNQTNNYELKFSAFNNIIQGKKCNKTYELPFETTPLF